jgi:ADP-ribosylglycohydrolase
VSERAITQRAIWAVVGSAVGDALGAPFEFGPPGECSRRFPEPVVDGIGEMVGGRLSSLNHRVDTADALNWLSQFI